MPVYKESNNKTWYVSVRYEDWTGKKNRKVKRGFATKREAVEWERRFLLKVSRIWGRLWEWHQRSWQEEHLGKQLVIR